MASESSLDLGSIFQGIGNSVQGLGSLAGAGGGIYYLASGQADKDRQNKIELEKLELEQAKIMFQKQPLDNKKIIMGLVIGVIIIMLFLRLSK